MEDDTRHDRATESGSPSRVPAPWPPRPRPAQPSSTPARATADPAPREPRPWERPAATPPPTGRPPWERPKPKQDDDDKTMAWQPAARTETPRREPWQPTATPAPRPVQQPAQRTIQAPVPRSTQQPVRTEKIEQRGAVTVRRLRRGRIAIRKIDPWAIFKFSLVFYFCMLLITLLTLGVVFAVMQMLGVVGNIERFLRELDLTVTIGGPFVFKWLFLIGLVGTLIASAVTMFMAFLYNLIADVVGGIELLVTERE